MKRIILTETNLRKFKINENKSESLNQTKNIKDSLNEIVNEITDYNNYYPLDFVDRHYNKNNKENKNNKNRRNRAWYYFGR